MKVRQENEERKKLIVHAPLPRREGVSGLPQRAAGIGLDKAPMLAPSLSLPDESAAVTARTRTRRKGRDHIQLAPSARHNDHTTPREQAPRVHLPGSQPAAGDRLASFANVALARHCRQDENEDKSRGAAHPLRGVPGLDRQALVAPKDHRTQARDASSSHRAPRPVALHPLEGGRVERRRRSLLRRLADVVRMGRTSHRRRTLVAITADASSRDRVRQVRLLDRVARGAVAEYLATMPRTGSVRFW